MNDREPYVPSIGMIIAMFIIFYPVGYILLFIRLNNKSQKKYTAVNEKNEPIRSFDPGTGYITLRNVYIAVALIMFMAMFSEVFESINWGYRLDIEFLVTCGIISVLALFLAYRRTAKLKKYQPYLNYLAAYGTDPIYDLAYSLGISREQAVKDLSDMIGSKIINASISDDDYIVLASNPAKIPSRSRYAKKFIRCPFCGAPNTIGPEEPRKCAYCDSPLE